MQFILYNSSKFPWVTFITICNGLVSSSMHRLTFISQNTKYEKKNKILQYSSSLSIRLRSMIAGFLAAVPGFLRSKLSSDSMYGRKSETSVKTLGSPLLQSSVPPETTPTKIVFVWSTNGPPLSPYRIRYQTDMMFFSVIIIFIRIVSWNLVTSQVP